uniref:Thymidylate kinase-like domain-containing protein n=2 Tax=Clastoptera arizonana TaxID=38151 RepID=A0A1B6BYP9_9HEMI
MVDHLPNFSVSSSISLTNIVLIFGFGRVLTDDILVTDPSTTVEEEELRKYGIYHSLPSLLNILRSEQFKDSPEANELYHTFVNECNYGTNQSLHVVRNKTGLWPLFVVEGVQTSGKLSASKRIAETLMATLLTTPPDCLYHLRSTFEKYNGTLRGVYYSLCNYALANAILKILPHSSVIVNRYWHSQAAFALALAEVEGYKISPLSHLYMWPEDLLVPDKVFFLQYSHSRPRNMQSVIRTMSRKFRDRMTQQFMRMRQPALQEIFEVQLFRQVGRILKIIAQEFPGFFSDIQ